MIKKNNSDDQLDVRVHPAMLHDDHILASVSNVYNAVLLEGDSVGQILLYGRGAGELPTASAVVSDIIDAARNISASSPVRVPMSYYSKSKEITVKQIDTITSRYYLRFTVVDQPGVLASITSELGKHGISIASVMQKEGYEDSSVPVIILTHLASEKGIKDSVAGIEKMSFIKDKTQIIRIES